MYLDLTELEFAVLVEALALAKFKTIEFKGKKVNVRSTANELYKEFCDFQLELEIKDHFINKGMNNGPIEK